MSCLRCQDLERAVEVKQREYSESLASAYYRISRKFAAYASVELERARNELEEHRLVCVSVVGQPAALAEVVRPRFTRQKLRGDWTKTAA